MKYKQTIFLTLSALIYKSASLIAKKNPLFCLYNSQNIVSFRYYNKKTTLN